MTKMPDLYGIASEVFTDETKFNKAVEKYAKLKIGNFRSSLKSFDYCLAGFQRDLEDHLYDVEVPWHKIVMGFFGIDTIPKIIEEINELISPITINIIGYDEAKVINGKDVYGIGAAEYSYDIDDPEANGLSATTVYYDFPKEYSIPAQAAISYVLGILLRNTSYRESYYNATSPYRRENCLEELLERSCKTSPEGHVTCLFLVTKDLIKALGDPDAMNYIFAKYDRKYDKQTSIWLTIRNYIHPELFEATHDTSYRGYKAVPFKDVENPVVIKVGRKKKNDY